MNYSHSLVIQVTLKINKEISKQINNWGAGAGLNEVRTILYFLAISLL